MKPTDAQRRLLQAVDECSPAEGWGEVFSHYDYVDRGDSDPSRFLAMCNFDRTRTVCERQGWILVEKEPYISIELTDAGRALLGATP